MIQIMVTEPVAESLLARWKLAGISPEVIETISKEIWDAINAGAPMDFRAVHVRLEELGVDWGNLHSPPPGPGASVPGDAQVALLRRIVPILGRMGVDREVISTIYKEIRAAAAAGKPMSLDQIVARLKELGVSLGVASAAI
jgi:hypothetical protein